MPDQVLVLNAGSSSLKFCVYGRPVAGHWPLRARGQVDGFRSAPRLKVRGEADQSLADESLPSTVASPGAALDVVMNWLSATFAGDRILGVGHRVVHGGEQHGAPVRITSAVLRELRALEPLAPLHQPDNLAAIEAVDTRLPGVAQVACFDTAFHRGHAPVAELLPLPAAVRARGLRRYGYHGLSCEYIAGRLPAVAPQIATGRVIVAHLGSGASLCALRNGRSVDSSFGFSALDGLCMGTRPGTLDPGVVLYLLQALHMSAAQVEQLLYRESGLLGISGLSADMRELLRSTEPAARLAVDYFVYRAAREIGSLAAVLGGIDGVVLTGGMGENSTDIRERIGAASAWLGVELDPVANRAGSLRISRGDSRVSAWVIPTDEELVIARHTGALLGLDGSLPGG